LLAYFLLPPQIFLNAQTNISQSFYFVFILPLVHPVLDSVFIPQLYDYTFDVVMLSW
jgi:hypothetical protein